MVPYVVRQGDYLTKLAARFGFVAKEVWDDPKNARIKELRKDGEVLYPGDLLYLPVRKKTSMPFKAGETNTYVAVVPKAKVVMRYFDEEGPWANESFVVEDMNPPMTGTTDGQGNLTISVPVTMQSVTLYFEKHNYRDVLLIGHLDPIEETSGLRQRLSALGFYRGDFLDPNEGPTTAAICQFQEKHGLSVTGKADQETLSAIAKAYHPVEGSG